MLVHLRQKERGESSPTAALLGRLSVAFSFIEDQQIVAIAGRLTFTQGGQECELRAGDCLRLGPPAKCRFEKHGNTACGYLVAALRRSR